MARVDLERARQVRGGRRQVVARLQLDRGHAGVRVRVARVDLQHLVEALLGVGRRVLVEEQVAPLDVRLVQRLVAIHRLAVSAIGELEVGRVAGRLGQVEEGRRIVQVELVAVEVLQELLPLSFGARIAQVVVDQPEDVAGPARRRLPRHDRLQLAPGVGVAPGRAEDLGQEHVRVGRDLRVARAGQAPGQFFGLGMASGAHVEPREDQLSGVGLLAREVLELCLGALVVTVHELVLRALQIRAGGAGEEEESERCTRDSDRALHAPDCVRGHVSCQRTGPVPGPARSARFITVLCSGP